MCPFVWHNKEKWGHFSIEVNVHVKNCKIKRLRCSIHIVFTYPSFSSFFSCNHITFMTLVYSIKISGEHNRTAGENLGNLKLVERSNNPVGTLDSLTCITYCMKIIGKVAISGLVIPSSKKCG